MTRNVLMNFFFQLSSGRRMQCPEASLDKYFETAEYLFNLPAGDGERILMRTQLANDRVTFWSERLVAPAEDTFNQRHTGMLQ